MPRHLFAPVAKPARSKRRSFGRRHWDCSTAPERTGRRVAEVRRCRLLIDQNGWGGSAIALSAARSADRGAVGGAIHAAVACRRGETEHRPSTTPPTMRWFWNRPSVMTQSHIKRRWSRRCHRCRAGIATTVTVARTVTAHATKPCAAARNSSGCRFRQWGLVAGRPDVRRRQNRTPARQRNKLRLPSEMSAVKGSDGLRDRPATDRSPHPGSGGKTSRPWRQPPAKARLQEKR